MQESVSTKDLIKYSVMALVFAGIILITAILPAEYNIDPTGIGTKLGLTKLAPENLAKQATTQQENDRQHTQQPEETITIVVPAKRGVEFKFAMQQFAKLKYNWSTDGHALYHDLHGEPKGDTTGYFESYVIATVTKAEGSFTAPFEGSHGWYWKNTSDEPVTVTLSTSGEYIVEGLKH